MPIGLTPNRRIDSYKNISQESEIVCCYTPVKLLWSLRFLGSNEPARSAVGSIHFLSISTALLLAVCFHRCFRYYYGSFQQCISLDKMQELSQLCGSQRKRTIRVKVCRFLVMKVGTEFPHLITHCPLLGVCQSSPCECTNSGATWDPYFLDDFKREHNCYFKTLWLQYFIFEDTP